MQKTEYEKMLAGELYDAGDKVLMQMRIACKSTECRNIIKLNTT